MKKMILMVAVLSVFLAGFTMPHDQVKLSPFWDSNGNGKQDDGEYAFNTFAIVFFRYNGEDAAGVTVSVQNTFDMLDISAPGVYVVTSAVGYAYCKTLTIDSRDPVPPVIPWPCQPKPPIHHVFLPMVRSTWGEIPAWDVDLNPGDIEVRK